MNSGCLKLYRSVSVVLSSIYKKQSWTILNWSWSKVVPLALLLNTFLRIPSQIIPSHNSPALSFGAPPRLFSEPLPVWYQFSIIPNNSRSCVCDIAVVTGPRSEVVSERKRHSKPRVQSVPADWRMSAVVDTRAFARIWTRVYTHCIWKEAWNKHGVACGGERSKHRWEFRREARGSNGMAEWNGMEACACVSLVARVEPRVHTRLCDSTTRTCVCVHAACRIAYTVPAVWD